MAELLPCPFCGGSAKFISFVDACSHRPACLVRCNDCGALTKDFVAEDSTFLYKDEAKKCLEHTHTKRKREIICQDT